MGGSCLRRIPANPGAPETQETPPWRRALSPQERPTARAVSFPGEEQTTLSLTRKGGEWCA